MRKNSKWLRFFYGTVLLCAVGTVGYRQLSYADNVPNQLRLQATESTQRTEAAPTIASAPDRVNVAPTWETQQSLKGFSSDSRHFIYLESWRDTGAGVPNAALHLVDLSANACVEAGCLQTSYGEADANLSVQAAESQLLNQTQTLRQTLNLTAPIAGSPLPVISRSRTPDGAETVTVQLQNGEPLQLRLAQTQRVSTLAGGTAEKDQAAIALTALYQGKETLISNPNQWHDWTLGFAIREVRQSPDGQAVVVLLTAEKRTFEGTLGRTIIHSLELPTQ